MQFKAWSLRQSLKPLDYVESESQVRKNKETRQIRTVGQH